MKTFKLMTLALSILSFGTHAAVLDYETFADETDTASVAKNQFELINENNNPIWVSIINGNKIIVDAKKVGSRSAFNENDVYAAPIDTNEKTKIAIYTEQPKPGSIELGYFGKVSFSGNPAQYEFPKSRTIYITYDADNQLVPSKPELPGGLNVTRTGLNLGNNVTGQEISTQMSHASTVVVEE